MINLIKLSVGSESVEGLTSWVEYRAGERKAAGLGHTHAHVTRMIPKRKEELLDGGSIYWVIKGVIQCRQKLVDIVPFTDGEGVRRCEIVMEPVLQLVRPRPRSPFQGWRYLEKKDAPPDLNENDGGGLPLELQTELATLGLL